MKFTKLFIKLVLLFITVVFFFQYNNRVENKKVIIISKSDSVISKNEQLYKYILTKKNSLLFNTSQKKYVLDTLYCNDSVQLLLNDSLFNKSYAFCNRMQKVMFKKQIGYVYASEIFDFKLDTSFLFNEYGIRSFFKKYKDVLLYEEKNIDDLYTIILKVNISGLSLCNTYSLLRIIHKDDFMPNTIKTQTLELDDDYCIIKMKVMKDSIRSVINIDWSYPGGENILKLTETQYGTDLIYKMIAD